MKLKSRLGLELVMHRIAHLSDVHILERRTPRDGSYSLSTRMVSFQRPLDGEARASKLKRALASVKRALADHVVISGDLTEMGTIAQFERSTARDECRR